MGAYLSEPMTEKNSSNASNEYLAVGSSSMQGWRISQEDAHNCILNFDKNTSLFAVYDGHGGAEVAQYCSLYFPKYLKELKAYKEKKFEEALHDAFLGFDATLLEEKVIEELKKLSDKTNNEEEPIEDEDDEEEEEDDNVADLCKEASMPLKDVLQKYKEDTKNPALKKIKEGSSSKPLSPFLKGKKREITSALNEAGSSSSAKSTKTDDESSIDKNSAAPETVDSTVTSSSSADSDNKPAESTTESNSKTEPDTKTEAAVKVKADSSSSKSDSEAERVVNGDTATTEDTDKASASCPPSSTSSVQENGTVSSNTHSSSTASATEGKETTNMDSSSGSAPGSSSSNARANSATKRKAALNGPAAGAMADDSEDYTDTDEEYPAVQDANEASSTEDGDEGQYCEETTEDEDEEEEDEGGEEEDEEDYFNEDDEAFMNNITDEPGKDSGCTAVVALVHRNEVFVANAGDSRCVISRNGEAIEMSFDHKPEDPTEHYRIKKAGGRVTLDGRVNGGLNLSRAIGDHGYKMNSKLPPKEQMISAEPDIKKLTLSKDDDFMILACDGIWNFMSNEDVVEFVQSRINNPTKTLSKICEELFDHCLAPHTKGDGTGCDNMTAIIVKFKPKLAAEGQSAKKRSASPETVSAGQESKKMKTEMSEEKCETTSSEASSKETLTAEDSSKDASETVTSNVEATSDANEAAASTST